VRALHVGSALVLALSVDPPAASAVSVRPGFTAAEMVKGLALPTAAAFAPDGRLIVLEQRGTVRLWSAAGGLRGEPLLTLPVCSGSEMGLLGLAFDPAAATNGFLYLYYTHPPGGDPARCSQGVNAGRVNRVVRVTLGAESIDPASLVVLVDGIRTDGGNHNGGCLRIGPDAKLYVGVGDTGRGDSGPPGAATNPYAQDLQHLEGKILRVELDGSAPADNPFVQMGGNAALVFAKGLRNPFRFAFDPIVPGPQLLWAGDVGQVTFEEIDIIRAGDDLGWPQCEGREPLDTCPGSSVPPIYAYRHTGGSNESVSITGGVHYDGSQFDETYHGDYFFGDFGLNEVYRADVTPTRDDFDGAPVVFSSNPGQPVDFLVGPDGALYWVAIGAGAVVRVTQDGRPGSAPGGCARRLGSAASRLFTKVAKRLAACRREPLESCRGLPGTRVVRRLARQAARSCDDSARPPLCQRLGCVPCDTFDHLMTCVASGAEAAVTMAAPLAGAEASACRTATLRAVGRAGGARFAAIVSCADDGAIACVPPPDPPDPTTGGIARPCAAPPESVCSALGCAPCATAVDLAACVATRVAGPVDALAGALLGIVQ
jgi:glucose/arabinose dehydrogenase